MFKNFNLLVFITIFISGISVYAQEISNHLKESSVDSSENKVRNWWIPPLEVVGTNLFIASYNRWVAQAEYAQISKKSVRENFDVGWVWDDDNFAVNQIGHPYQGGLYYSSARYFGHDYFTSMAFSSFGSVQWEFFMETEHPAINDLITTTMGGAMFGEITTRLASEILDDGSSGTERFFRELGAGLINPVIGINRILSGKSYQSGVSQSKADLLFMVFSTGGEIAPKLLGNKSPKEGGGSSDTDVPIGKSAVWLVYGDPFKVKKPFDHFLLNVGFSFKKDWVGNVSGRGSLLKKDLYKKNKTHSILSLIQDFDFVNSGAFRVAASGLGVEWATKIPFGKDWVFMHRNQFLGIALGGASTEYYVNVERDYNLGPGAGMKALFVLRKMGFGKMSFMIDRYWIHTVSGADGDEFIGLGRAEILKTVYKKFGIAFQYDFYDREGRYKDFENATVFNHQLRLLFTWGIH